MGFSMVRSDSSLYFFFGGDEEPKPFPPLACSSSVVWKAGLVGEKAKVLLNESVKHKMIILDNMVLFLSFVDASSMSFRLLIFVDEGAVGWSMSCF